MAIAGKVAITPGGEWSATVAYDKLVVVTYNNNVYLSTKTSTGVAPTDTEHWMLLVENVTQEQYDAIINGTTTVGNALQLGGKDASEYAVNSTELLKTCILEKALTLGSNECGFFRLAGGNYTGTDLPSSTYKYSSALVVSRSNDKNVILFGVKNLPIAVNNYDKTTTTWNGWQTLATTADLANYLPLKRPTIGKWGTSEGGRLNLEKSDDSTLGGNQGIEAHSNRMWFYEVGGSNRGAYLELTECSEVWNNKLLHTGNVGSYALPLDGGTLSRPSPTPLVLQNTDSVPCYMIYRNRNSLLGYIGFSAVDNPIVLGSSGTKLGDILHTGNSAKVAIQESAPTDTSALWVDTANKVTKAYIDGAWTQVA